MTTIPMPETVMRVYAEGSMRVVTEWKGGALDLPDGDHDLITTTQAEAYADARVREALRSLLRDMNGHVRAAHSRFGETGKPYDEGRRIAYEQAAADIRALIQSPRVSVAAGCWRRTDPRD